MEKNVKELKPVTDASSLNREETLEILSDCQEIVERVDSLYRSKEKISSLINERNKKVNEIREDISGTAMFLIWGVPFIMAIIVAALFEMVIGCVIVFIVMVYLMDKIVGKNYKKKHRAENEARAQAFYNVQVVPLINQVNEINSEIEEIKESGALEWVADVVGDELVNTNDINALISIVKGRRADNLKEALNTYDNIRHQERMEEMQYSIQQATEATAVEASKQTVQLREIEKNTHQTAEASKITAANTYATYKTAKKIDKDAKKIYKKL